MRPSRVAVYISAHGATRWVQVLEGSVKATCSLQIATALATTAFGIWTILEQPDLAAEHAWRGHLHASRPSPAAASPPPHIWFAWFMLCAGLVTAGVSSLGIVSAARRAPLLLNSFLVATGVQLATELCACVAFFLQLQADQHPSPLTGGMGDVTIPLHIRAEDGESAPHALSVTRVIAAGGMVLQVITLSIGCLLASAYAQVEEAADDEDAADGAGWGARGVRQPLLQGGGVEQTQGGDDSSRARGGAVLVDEGGGEEWRQRMMERYGVDTSLLSYDPRAARRSTTPPTLTRAPGAAGRHGIGRAGHLARAGAGGQEGAEEARGGRCCIM